MRRLILISVLSVAVAGVVACGGASPSGPSAVAGATITGTLVSPGSGSSASTGSVSGASAGLPADAPAVPPGLIVAVSGTTISVQVGPNGTFTLLNVPSGNAELRFSAPGILAVVSLLGLESGQNVSVDVSLTGSSATIESERRSLGSEAQLEGRVESLPPTTDPLTFLVAGRLVTTDASTQFFLRGTPGASFDSLEIGQRVHVKGVVSGSTLLARSVDIQNTNTGLGVNINGIVENFSGTFDAFQFEIGGRLIEGDAATVFFGNSTFADLADGKRAEVKGILQDGFVYAARIHVEDSDATEVEFTGVISAISGTPPDLTLTIDGQTVITGLRTEVRRKGDVQRPAVLQVGMTVDVTGLLQTDGTVVAKKINIQGDAPGGEFEMHGTLAGLSGTCPAVTFSVSGYAITTDGTTTFDPACSAFSNGTKIEVKGIVQNNGSVLATAVKKQ